MRISKSLLSLPAPSSASRAKGAPERNGGQGGFTLIELLAVLLILSILVTFLVRSVRSAQISVEVGNTKALIQTIGGLVEEYNNEFQRYPPSTFPASLDPKPNRINMGSEMLVISLWRQGRPWQAAEIGEDALGNTDLDSTKTSLTRFSSADASRVRSATLSRWVWVSELLGTSMSSKMIRSPRSPVMLPVMPTLVTLWVCDGAAMAMSNPRLEDRWSRRGSMCRNSGTSRMSCRTKVVNLVARSRFADAMTTLAFGLFIRYQITKTAVIHDLPTPRNAITMSLSGPCCR